MATTDDRRTNDRSLLMERILERHCLGLPILPDVELRRTEDRFIAGLLDDHLKAQQGGRATFVVVRVTDERGPTTVAECGSIAFAQGVIRNWSEAEPDHYFESFEI